MLNVEIHKLSCSTIIVVIKLKDDFGRHDDLSIYHYLNSNWLRERVGENFSPCILAVPDGVSRERRETPDMSKSGSFAIFSEHGPEGV